MKMINASGMASVAYKDQGLLSGAARLTKNDSPTIPKYTGRNFERSSGNDVLKAIPKRKKAAINEQIKPNTKIIL